MMSMKRALTNATATTHLYGTLLNLTSLLLKETVQGSAAAVRCSGRRVLAPARLCRRARRPVALRRRCARAGWLRRGPRQAAGVAVTHQPDRTVRWGCR